MCAGSPIGLAILTTVANRCLQTSSEGINTNFQESWKAPIGLRAPVHRACVDLSSWLRRNEVNKGWARPCRESGSEGSYSGHRFTVWTTSMAQLFTFVTPVKVGQFSAEGCGHGVFSVFQMPVAASVEAVCARLRVCSCVCDCEYCTCVLRGLQHSPRCEGDFHSWGEPLVVRVLTSSVSEWPSIILLLLYLPFSSFPSIWDLYR